MLKKRKNVAGIKTRKTVNYIYAFTFFELLEA